MPQAISLIKDGAKVVVGGVLTAREPNAIARQIIKDGKKDLHMIAGAHSFMIDLLCAGGAVGICEDSFVGYEFDLGLACLLYTSPSPRDGLLSRMPSSA